MTLCSLFNIVSVNVLLPDGTSLYLKQSSSEGYKLMVISKKILKTSILGMILEITYYYSRIFHFCVSVADVKILRTNTIRTMFADVVTPWDTKVSAVCCHLCEGSLFLLLFQRVNNNNDASTIGDAHSL